MRVREKLILWDRAATRNLQGRPPQLRQLMFMVTLIGGIVFTALLTSVLVVVLRLRGDVFYSNVFFGVGMVMIVFGGLIKYVWRRKRPDTEYSRNMFFSTYSFPSGHAFDSTLLYGVIAYCLASQASPGVAAVYIAGTILLVLAVIYSRVYLGAHYILDVLAGLLLGGVFLAGFIFFVL